MVQLHMEWPLEGRGVSGGAIKANGIEITSIRGQDRVDGRCTAAAPLSEH